VVEFPAQITGFIAVAERIGVAHNEPETIILYVQETPAKPSSVIK
jgi:hypothetical protein